MQQAVPVLAVQPALVVLMRVLVIEATPAPPHNLSDELAVGVADAAESVWTSRPNMSSRCMMRQTGMSCHQSSSPQVHRGAVRM